MNLRRLAQVLRGVLASLRNPPRYPPGHYYSALTAKEDVERASRWGQATTPPGLEIDPSGLRLAEQLAPAWPKVEEARRYHDSTMYVQADAAIYSSMIQHFRPRRIIEIGSGFSTAIAIDTAESIALDLELTCIEPYPSRLRSLLLESDSVELLVEKVQDVPLGIYDQLSSNDFLFIDSSHVVKSGSDVVWNMLHVLPRLASGVFVHIHDMFWPMEYPSTWLKDRRDWTEIYLVHAFLLGNPEWEVVLFNDLIWSKRRDLVEKYLPTAQGQRPGGLWLRRK